MSQAPWSSVAYQMAEEARQEPQKRSLLLALPSLLSQGASALEVAKMAAAKPDAVESLLRELSSYRVVEAHSSGASVPFAGTLYYLTSDGSQFFKELEYLLSSQSRGLGV
jgi:hypothetical protein